jgi:4-amino-4-deoxychorismate mutase
MEKLTEYRILIDSIDAGLIELLGKRFAVCRDVARLKKERAIPMMQGGRVDEVKERCATLAASHGVDPQFVRELYTLIIEEACRIEDRIIDAAD